MVDEDEEDAAPEDEGEKSRGFANATWGARAATRATVVDEKPTITRINEELAFICLVWMKRTVDK
jgi:hypothetical protein